MTNELELTLDALVANAPVDRADWSDVTRRARRPRRRLSVGLAIVLALTTIAVATPAFGIGGRVRDLFEGTPATPSVHESFVTWNASRGWAPVSGSTTSAGVAAAKYGFARLPAVDPSKAHGVVAVHLSSRVTFQVWAAPLAGGGECSILMDVDARGAVRGGASGGGESGCVTPTTSPAPRPLGTHGAPGAPGLGVMPGIAPGAASVEIRFGDGKTVRAPVVEGFFLAPVSNPRIGSAPRSGARPRPGPGVFVTQVISFDAQGSKVGETTTQLKAIADYLGFSFAKLWAEFPGDKTLAQIATGRGKTVSGLVDAIVANAKAGFDAQVTAGQLTAAQETSSLAASRRDADGMVNGVPPALPATPGPLPTTTETSVSLASVGVVFPPQSSGGHSLTRDRLNVVTGGAPGIVFELTLHNGGNAQEAQVPVTLTIDGARSIGGPIVKSATLDSIGPNETKTTTITIDGPVPFGDRLTLRVTVGNGPARVYPVIFALPTG